MACCFQTGTKFEAFFATMRSSVFFAKSPGFTTKIPSRSDLEWAFRQLLYAPFERACAVTINRDLPQSSLNDTIGVDRCSIPKDSKQPVQTPSDGAYTGCSKLNHNNQLSQKCP